MRLRTLFRYYRRIYRIYIVLVSGFAYEPSKTMPNVLTGLKVPKLKKSMPGQSNITKLGCSKEYTDEKLALRAKYVNNILRQFKSQFLIRRLGLVLYLFETNMHWAWFYICLKQTCNYLSGEANYIILNISKILAFNRLKRYSDVNCALGSDSVHYYSNDYPRT